jgi:hypothetical protein
MNNRNTRFLGLALTCVLTASVIAGCGNKNDAVPSVEQTKTIAEEGFIYGLPIVMNYAVMNEYAVDKNSSQFKAPFNEIYNMHRVATYEDTAPNDTIYLVMRLYWPKETPPSILPAGAGSWQPPGIVQTK